MTTPESGRQSPPPIPGFSEEVSAVLHSHARLYCDFITAHKALIGRPLAADQSFWDHLLPLMRAACEDKNTGALVWLLAQALRRYDLDVPADLFVPGPKPKAKKGRPGADRKFTAYWFYRWTGLSYGEVARKLYKQADPKTKAAVIKQIGTARREIEQFSAGNPSVPEPILSISFDSRKIRRNSRRKVSALESTEAAYFYALYRRFAEEDGASRSPESK